MGIQPTTKRWFMRINSAQIIKKCGFKQETTYKNTGSGSGNIAGDTKASQLLRGLDVKIWYYGLSHEQRILIKHDKAIQKIMGPQIYREQSTVQSKFTQPVEIQSHKIESQQQQMRLGNSIRSSSQLPHFWRNMHATIVPQPPTTGDVQSEQHLKSALTMIPFTSEHLTAIAATTQNQYLGVNLSTSEGMWSSGWWFQPL